MNSKFIAKFALIFVIVLVVVHLLTFFLQMGIADYYYCGFPFKYLEGGGMCVEDPCPSEFNASNLIFDLIIWLAVSTAIALACPRLKKQLPKN